MGVLAAVIIGIYAMPFVGLYFVLCGQTSEDKIIGALLIAGRIFIALFSGEI